MAHQVRHRLLKTGVVGEGAPKGGAFHLVPMLDGPARRECYLGAGRFRFLNVEADLGWPVDWRAEGQPKLWQYNLHYFDFLNQAGMTYAEGLGLVEQWIANHPPARGAVGWEPYPISLRVVNWLKFFARFKTQPARGVIESLALQGWNLERQVEYHILGNHLFENAKALCFLGEFLELEKWEKLGRRILAAQVPEQFLEDGGHFELSAMYHCILLEGLLDLVNLWQRGGRAVPEGFRGRVERALGWMSEIMDSRGRVPLFNDAAEGIAPLTGELLGYGERLGVAGNTERLEDRRIGEWRVRNLSGYWVAKHPRLQLWFDAAPIGPDYLPGHAHGDMLSVLLDFDGCRILEDTGVFEYQESARRSYSRGVRAHNTISIDGMDQAEFWKSFRVGRRGYPVEPKANSEGVRCSHSGFESQGRKVRHERKIHFLQDGFEICDTMSGAGVHEYESRYHCAPGTRLRPIDNHRLAVNETLRFEFTNAVPIIEQSEFYPEYGKMVLRPCIRLHGQFRDRVEVGLKCISSS